MDFRTCAAMIGQAWVTRPSLELGAEISVGQSTEAKRGRGSAAEES